MSIELYDTKAISGFEVSDADRGEVVAVVSTMNVVDRDGDVILSGAVADGSVVKISAYDHDVILQGLPPVGIGQLAVQGDRVVMTGNYFLGAVRGREAFETVKGLGKHSEWSIGFPKQVKTAPLTDSWRAKGARRLIAGMTILETSPVFQASNPETGTLAAKAAAAAVEAVDTAEAAWLKRLYADHVLPFELRAALQDAEETLEQSELRAIALSSLERDLTRPWAHHPPATFEPVIEFARAQLGLDWRALPAPRLVRKGSLRSAEDTPCRGVFNVVRDKPRIFLEDTGDMDDMILTFFHEAIHSKQHHFFDPMTEPDAVEQAAELFAAWQNVDR